MNVAVVIPCYNEECTIKDVIDDYKKYFDHIYVIDNNCTDNTVNIAKDCGAIILKETTQGKGAAIQKAFNEIDSDFIVLTDGDSTYRAKDSEVLTKYLIERDLDMVVGNRLNCGYFTSHQKLHGIGNKWFSKKASKLYNHKIKDLLSGSRVISRELYKSIKLDYTGFEVETELTKLCILNNYSIDYLDIDYLERPKDSKSSLNIIRDGFKILLALFA